MGDHTDYNEGFVLPMAIELETVIAAAPDAGGRVRVRSLGEDEPVDVAADGSDEPRAVEPGWGRYVAGVVRALAARGVRTNGLEAALDSSVPAGSGLSSSAALEVAVALAVAASSGSTLDAEGLALACQEAEHLATGVPSGIMDQLSSVGGREGHALLIDCRDLSIEHVAMLPELAVVVVHSGIPRTLERSAYAERRAGCEQIARELGVRALRDATPAQVADRPLGRHVVSENARVLATADALRSADGAALSQLFAASHASLRDDYEVSTPELDALVEELVAAGALGARLTGAGFGGAVVAVCEAHGAESVGETAAAAYARRTGLRPFALVTRAAAGAGPVE